MVELVVEEDFIEFEVFCQHFQLWFLLLLARAVTSVPWRDNFRARGTAWIP